LEKYLNSVDEVFVYNTVFETVLLIKKVSAAFLVRLILLTACRCARSL